MQLVLHQVPLFVNAMDEGDEEQNVSLSGMLSSVSLLSLYFFLGIVVGHCCMQQGQSEFGLGQGSSNTVLAVSNCVEHDKT